MGSGFLLGISAVLVSAGCGADIEPDGSATGVATGALGEAGWTPLNGVASGISLSQQSDTVADVWASGGGSNKAIWRRTFNASTSAWTAWTSMNAGPPSSPGAGAVGAPSILWLSNLADVVVRDLSGQVQWAQFNYLAPSWSNWSQVGASVQLSDVSPVISLGPTGDHVWVFGISFGKLVATRRQGGSWSSWSGTSGPPGGFASGLAVAGNSNIVNVAARSQDGHIYLRQLQLCPGGGSSACWTPTWVDLGVSPGGQTWFGTPAAVFTKTSPSFLNVYAMATGDEIWAWQSSVGWSFVRFGAPGSAAAAMATSEPTLAIQVRSTTSEDHANIGTGQAVWFKTTFPDGLSL